MTTTQTIIDEVKALRGAQVSIFGQPTTLHEEVDRFEIDIIDVLESLEAFEVTSWEVPTYTEDEDGDEVEAWEDILEECADGDEAFFALQDAGEFASDWKGDNSYNWSAPLSNDFDIRCAEASDGGYWVALAVHRFGDVRGNYTPYALYHFRNDYDFFEVVSESNRYEAVEVDGATYDVEINIFSDTFEVWDTNGSYIGEAYGMDADEIAEVIREKIA